MRRTLRRFYAVAALVLVVAGLVFLSLLQPVVGTRTDFSIYNGRWNGASGLAVDIQGYDALIPGFSVETGESGVTLVQKSLTDFEPDPRAMSLVVLGPATPPTAEEGRWLRRFVEEGGRVLLADDVGTGNEFLQALGSPSRFDPRLVLDLVYAKRPEFPVASDLAPHPALGGAREVVLDRAGSLREGPGATVLARTGPASWIDVDGDLVPDQDEPRGPFPWLAVETLGRGEILLLSDPSLLVNGMREAGDNAAARAGIVAWLTEGGRGVLIDESHHDYPDPVRLASATLRQVPLGLRVGVAAGVAALILVLVAYPPRGLLARPLAHARRLGSRLLPSAPPAEPDLVALALERHPGWDENTLRRIRSSWGKR